MKLSIVRNKDSLCHLIRGCVERYADSVKSDLGRNELTIGEFSARIKSANCGMAFCRGDRMLRGRVFGYWLCWKTGLIVTMLRSIHKPVKPNELLCEDITCDSRYCLSVRRAQSRDI